MNNKTISCLIIMLFVCSTAYAHKAKNTHRMIKSKFGICCFHESNNTYNYHRKGYVHKRYGIHKHYKKGNWYGIYGYNDSSGSNYCPIY